MIDSSGQEHEFPIRILVVDDEPWIRDGFSRLLERDGYDVRVAESGEEALTLMEDIPADVVLTDIRMPEMSGLELLKHLHNKYPETDVIMISGHGQMDDVITALREGAHDYLQKPVSFEELQIVISRLLDLRQNRQRMKEMEEKLYYKQKMDGLATLAAGVAHEFNNLMSGVVGYSELALSTQNADHMQKALHLGRDAGAKAAKIARNLLRFASRERYHRNWVDLNQLLTETIDLIRSDFEHDGIVLTTHLHGYAQLYLDESQLQQVLLNLLNNAHNALCQEGVVDRHVSIHTRHENDQYILEIQDTGGGVPEDAESRIFEPFFTTRGVISGGDITSATGLGLSVANGIIQGHGGNIGFDNRPGEGISFIISLPIQSAQLAQHEKHILICDDEQSVRRIMRKVLEHEGFVVGEAENGEEALKALTTEKYDLLLLDHMIPGLSGLDVLTRMQEEDIHIPVVMITALMNQELARQAVATGARECVFKPVNSAHLIFLANKYTKSEMHPSDSKLVVPPPVNMGRKTILVVEEDPVTRDIYSVVLEREGYHVEVACSGEEAVDLTDEACFDLMVVDLKTNSLSGPGILQALRINNPYTPIILSVREVSAAVIRKGLQAGASRVVEKPIRVASLLDDVRSLLALYGQPAG